jgi:hypothetical protein
MRLDQAEKLLALATDVRGNDQECRNAAMHVCRFLKEKDVFGMLRKLVEEYERASRR